MFIFLITYFKINNSEFFKYVFTLAVYLGSVSIKIKKLQYEKMEKTATI